LPEGFIYSSQWQTKLFGNAPDLHAVAVPKLEAVAFWLLQAKRPYGAKAEPKRSEGTQRERVWSSKDVERVRKFQQAKVKVPKKAQR
jgi:hypothetical protein